MSTRNSTGPSRDGDDGDGGGALRTSASLVTHTRQNRQAIGDRRLANFNRGTAIGKLQSGICDRQTAIGETAIDKLRSRNGNRQSIIVNATP
jgi:hypothetical protein